MAIKGNLSEASLPDVLQLLAMGNKTGALTVASGRIHGTICFEAGRICHASVQGRQIGTEDAVYAMFPCNEGTFSFEPGMPPPEGAQRFSLDPQALLLEGARRVDEWSVIEKKLPSFDAVFAIDRQQLLRNSIGLTPEQQRLLPLIDGSRDLNELMRVSRMSEFDVGKALFGLLSGGFLVRVGAVEGEASPVPESVISEHRNLGTAFYKAGMYGDAAREFRRILELRSTDAVAAFYLGLIALRDDRWNDAATFFQRSAVSAPRASAVLINMAYAYERLGQLEKARLALEQVVARSPKPEPVALIGLAGIAIQREDLDGAGRLIQSAREALGTRQPGPVWFHYAGLEALLRGDAQRATAILTEGVALHSHPVLFNNLEAAQRACGALEDALKTQAASPWATATGAAAAR